ncbi:AMP-binding protein [Roseibium sp. RKSG952]|uniref:AMP-binding protein n=1 Tax=Roseibium sp. RKSG952 TaxID=2529384 RepID=UPI0012BCC173|nr:AMP-binding protein [Roseibium sp. RKSG952]MTH95351.1 hypothetical protein [Roseibium sp. RKSG952]
MWTQLQRGFDLHEEPPSNLADMLERAVPENAGCRFIFESDAGTVRKSYADVFEEARCLRNQLHAAGLNRDRVVVAVLDRAEDFIPLAWACLSAGIPLCPVTPNSADRSGWDRLVRYLTDLFNHPAIMTRRQLNRIFDHQEELLILEDLRSSSAPSDLTLSSPVRRDATAMLSLTSGSTGLPKAVVLTHGMILTSLAACFRENALSTGGTYLNWLLFDHIGAFMNGLLRPAYSGSSVVNVPAASVLSDPAAFWRLASDFGVSTSFVPNFILARTVVDAEKPDFGERMNGVDLSAMQHLTASGEAIVSDTVRKTHEVLAPYGLAGDAIWPSFGMTETCTGCIYNRHFSSEGQSEFASVGWPIEDMELRIACDPDESDIGELQLRGPMVFGEYYRNPEATREAFTDDGWFRTGDLGTYSDSEGLLLVGRAKDTVIVNGNNFSLKELETALEKLDGIKPGTVAAFPTRKRGGATEDLVVFFHPLNGRDGMFSLAHTVSSIQKLTVLKWGVRPALALPVPERVLVRSSLGKIKRTDLRRRLEAGEFSALVQEASSITQQLLGEVIAPRTSTEEGVLKIMSEAIGLTEERIGVRRSFFDLGGTSIEFFRLQALLREKFTEASGIGLIDLMQEPTAEAIAKLIEGGTVGKRPYNPLVLLQGKGAGRPVFCIHDGMGDVMVFLNLSQFFSGERPFYGIRARGIEEEEEPFETFEELVMVYADAIRRKQEIGPYIIAGYSLGALIAFLVGQRLEELGEEVAVIGIAGIVGAGHEEPPDLVDTAVKSAFFLGLCREDQITDMDAFLRLNPDIDPIEHTFRHASLKRLEEIGLCKDHFERMVRVSCALKYCQIRHAVSGSVGRMSVLCPDTDWIESEEVMEREFRHCQKYSRYPLKFIKVPGSHNSVMNAENISIFQEKFREYIYDVNF